jgi:dynein heavy chain, axonemal
MQVHNLFAKDELDAILEDVSPRAKAAGNLVTPATLHAFFVAECRKNLHLVLIFSPVGEAFRKRLRMFPALMNCCTIDWFSEWPADGLRAVALQALADVCSFPFVLSCIVAFKNIEHALCAHRLSCGGWVVNEVKWD